MSNSEKTSNVVVTGVGPVSALGFGCRALDQGMRGARSGIGEITLIDPEPYGSRQAGEIPEFDVQDYLDSQKTYLDRSSEVAFAALKLAMQDAALKPADIGQNGAGIMLGSLFGNQSTVELFYNDLLEKGPRLVKPILFPNAYPNTTISLLAIEYGLDGVHLNFAGGFNSSMAAVAAAYDHIQQGKAQMIFAGGYEVLSESGFYGLAELGRLSPNDGGQENCSPFDQAANGFVMGEGAALFVLESENHAKARGAPIKAEINAVSHRSCPMERKDGATVREDTEGNPVLDAMRTVMCDAETAAEEIDCIFAHADGDAGTDKIEVAGCRDICETGQAAIPVTTTKPMTGECLGAGGGVQLAAAVTAMENGYIPPVLNLGTPGAGAENLDIVRDGAWEQALNQVMVNSVDPGGSAVSVIIGT